MIEIILLFLALIIIIFGAKAKPDYYFWVFLFLSFDPGGFIKYYFEGKLLGPLTTFDIMATLLLLPIITVKRNIGRIADPIFWNFFKLLTIFLLFYFFLYGFFVPLSYGREDYGVFLLKNRQMLFVLPIFYGTYVFTMRSSELFLKILAFSSISILSLYFFSLITGDEIIGIIRMERYREGGIERVGILSYGLIKWVYIMGLILFLLRDRFFINRTIKLLLYLSSIMMLITLLLTFTRREFINVVFQPIIILLLFALFLRGRSAQYLLRIGIPIALIILSINFIAPNLLESIVTVMTDTFSIILTGYDTRGMSDYRVSGTGDMLYVKEIILDNLFFGVGYIPGSWSEIVTYNSMGGVFGAAYDAAGEVPIVGALFWFGMIGVIMMSPIYLFLIKNIFRTLYFLRHSIGIKINSNFAILLYVLTSFISMFTIRIFDLFSQVYDPYTAPQFVVALGMYCAISHQFMKRNSTNSAHTYANID